MMISITIVDSINGITMIAPTTTIIVVSHGRSLTDINPHSSYGYPPEMV